MVTDKGGLRDGLEATSAQNNGVPVVDEHGDGDSAVSLGHADRNCHGLGPSEEVAATVILRDLVVKLGRGRASRRAVDGLSLSLGVGVHGLLGPNGAGKTTLMRVLATAIAPTSGSVRLLGRDVSLPESQREVRRFLGYLPQSFGFYPRFTVREFVTYFAWLKEYQSSTPSADVETAIARVGLSDRADTRLKSLSGGMLRRAGLAQALVNEPELLLLDEPTAGLDPEQRMDFRALLRDLATDTTVVVSTHLVEDVASACTHVTLMDQGQLVWGGTPGELSELASPRQADDSETEGDEGGARAEERNSAIEAGYTAAMRAHRRSGTAISERARR